MARIRWLTAICLISVHYHQIHHPAASSASTFLIKAFPYCCLWPVSRLRPCFLNLCCFLRSAFPIPPRRIAKRAEGPFDIGSFEWLNFVLMAGFGPRLSWNLITGVLQWLWFGQTPCFRDTVFPLYPSWCARTDRDSPLCYGSCFSGCYSF